MKKFIGIGLIALLAGCASVDYLGIEDSQAVISNLKVKELGKVGTDKHQLDVKFDYSIINYHDTPKLYTCSVLFVSSQNEMVTKSKQRHPCNIDSNNGSVSISWDTPLSTSANYSKQALSKMVLPLKYHVAIHQKKTNNTNVVIGMSDTLFLSPKT